MLLSITSHGRNDGWMGNFLWRLQTTLNKMGRNLEHVTCREPYMADAVEIVLVDWGSPPNARLHGMLDLEPSCKKFLKHFYFHPDIVKSVEGDSKYSSSHSTNAAVRRTSGKYVLSCDSDVYWQEDTMDLLWNDLLEGRIGDVELDKTFFWSARRHVPKAYNETNPSIEALDDYIRQNWQAFAVDKPNKENFDGAACALLMKRDYWFELHGLDERLRHWGVNDLEIHRRLVSRYRWGGDIDDHGMRLFHLEHYTRADGHRNLAAENPRRANEDLGSPKFQANDVDTWGMGRYNAELVWSGTEDTK